MIPLNVNCAYSSSEKEVAISTELFEKLSCSGNYIHRRFYVLGYLDRKVK